MWCCVQNYNIFIYSMQHSMTLLMCVCVRACLCVYLCACGPPHVYNILTGWRMIYSSSSAWFTCFCKVCMRKKGGKHHQLLSYSCGLLDNCMRLMLQTSVSFLSTSHARSYPICTLLSFLSGNFACWVLITVAYPTPNVEPPLPATAQVNSTWLVIHLQMMTVSCKIAN